MDDIVPFGKGTKNVFSFNATFHASSFWPQMCPPQAERSMSE
jgi:hypothetical protein